MVGVACARPQAGTDTAASQAATPAPVADEEPAVEEPVAPDDVGETSAEGLLQTGESDTVADGDVADLAFQAPVEDTIPVAEAPPMPEVLSPPTPAGRQPSEEARDFRWTAPPPAPEPDHRLEERRLKAAAAAYRAELRTLEGLVRSAERAVQAAEVALSQARETPKTLGGPMVNNAPCVLDEPVVILPPPDIPSLVAAAEERLQRARDELKAARDTEDDLFTKMRRERIPLSDVL